MTNCGCEIFVLSVGSIQSVPTKSHFRVVLPNHRHFYRVQFCLQPNRITAKERAVSTSITRARLRAYIGCHSYPIDCQEMRKFYRHMRLLDVDEGNKVLVITAL